MLRRTTPKNGWRYLIATAVAAGLLAVPALGAAAPGGGGSGGSGGAGVGPNGQSQPGNGTVTASANGITITTRASGFYRRIMQFSGSAGRRHAGRVIEIERASHQTGGQWVPTTSATIAQDGTFTAQWKVDHAGAFAVRAVVNTSGGGQTASSWPTVKVTVYKVSLATIYGPGLWGNGTACGEKLRPSTMGVANRTLPCGTRVSIYYRGRTIVVPVIDRGPYANGANWDLTEATAHALKMPGTAKVGATPVPPQ